MSKNEEKYIKQQPREILRKWSSRSLDETHEIPMAVFQTIFRGYSFSAVYVFTINVLREIAKQYNNPVFVIPERSELQIK